MIRKILFDWIFPVAIGVFCLGFMLWCAAWLWYLVKTLGN